MFESEAIKRRFPYFYIHSWPHGAGWGGIEWLLCRKLEKENGGRALLTVKYWGFLAFEMWNSMFSRAEKLYWFITYRHLGWFPYISDVKEKYGRLALNGGNMDDISFKSLVAAERLSGATCQEWGARGGHIPLDWHHTVCKKHASEQDKIYIHNLSNGIEKAIARLT